MRMEGARLHVSPRHGNTSICPLSIPKHSAKIPDTFLLPIKEEEWWRNDRKISPLVHVQHASAKWQKALQFHRFYWYLRLQLLTPSLKPLQLLYVSKAYSTIRMRLQSLNPKTLILNLSPNPHPCLSTFLPSCLKPENPPFLPQGHFSVCDESMSCQKQSWKVTVLRLRGQVLLGNGMGKLLSDISALLLFAHSSRATSCPSW